MTTVTADLATTSPRNGDVGLTGFALQPNSSSVATRGRKSGHEPYEVATRGGWFVVVAVAKMNNAFLKQMICRRSLDRAPKCSRSRMTMLLCGFRVLFKHNTQVAAVAGVRGVPATAGVLGGCSATFSRKAASLSARCPP